MITPHSKEFFLAWPDQIRKIDPEKKPLWGLMSPQHAVEHMVGSWRISNGRARVKTVLPPEEIAIRRAFLFSEKPYARNIENPVTGNGLAALRKPNFSAAVDQLQDEIEAFFHYHESNPGIIEVHPVFGELDMNGWLTFQTKHMGHHLAQFAI